jgi:hypothetical protein
MKHRFIVSICVALAVGLFPGGCDATCTASSGPCQEGSGKCYDAVRLALAGNVLDAADALVYGKYCGAKNFCKVVRKKRAVTDGTCRKKRRPKSRALFLREGGAQNDAASAPCPAVPCDDIDASCAAHDACLDEEIRMNRPPPGERVPVPARCNCDVDLVSKLAVQATLAPPTGLCDDAFYKTDVSDSLPVPPVSLVGHEAVLLAAPFCCVVFAPGCATDARPGGGTNPVNYAVALGFCTTVFWQLAQQGITNICSSLQ